MSNATSPLSGLSPTATKLLGIALALGLIVGIGVVVAKSMTSSDAVTKNYGNQKLWKEASDRARSETVQMFEEKRTLKEVLQNLADCRLDVAQRQGTDKAEEFGKPRPSWGEWVAGQEQRDQCEYRIIVYSGLDESDELLGTDPRLNNAKDALGERTPMSKRYEVGRILCQEKYDNLKSEDETPDFQPCEFSDIVADGVREGFNMKTGPLKGYRSLGRIPGREEPLELTGSVFTGEEPKDDEAGGAWVHTRSDYIPLIMDHVGNIQKAILEVTPDEDPDAIERITLLASGVWWLFHAMPYKRGSAGIVEWYLESALQHFGVNLGIRKGGMDLQAFSMSEKEFTEKFKTFFDNG
jgi:hypothetical protein